MEKKIVEIIKDNWFNKFPEGIECEGEMSNRGARKAAKEIVKLFNIPVVSVPKGTVCEYCNEPNAPSGQCTNLMCTNYLNNEQTAR